MEIKVIEMGEVEKISRVKADAETEEVCRTVLNAFKKSQKVIFRAIGAGAINQTMKGIASAAIELKKGPMGIGRVLVEPFWFNGKGGNDEDISGLEFKVVYIAREES